MKTKPSELTRVLVTDCGSTTTKALLFEKLPDRWGLKARGEAPTTVEEPVADVTVGALNAFNEIEEIASVSLLGESPGTAQQPFRLMAGEDLNGIDLYLSTSSAGGGLQMVVAGIVDQMSTESAERAALGAGAIVMGALSADDHLEDHERIERLRNLRPDIVLLTGGIDGGDRVHVVETAELLLAAAPRPRFGETLRLPVIYAGNRDAAEEVSKILAAIAQVSIVANVRPTLEGENLGPAREAIHEFFLTHVMSHSPGYDKLLGWTPVPVMPTPAAVGNMVDRYAQETDQEVLCVDIGGATTDVFSVFKNREGKPIFHRTVSANLGMSYSVANVLNESGPENIARWLAYQIDSHDLRDRLRNKMIRPTSIPQSIEDLWLEQAVCREALRLSLEHHRSLAVGLSGRQQQRGIADIFSQEASRYELLNRMRLNTVIGSGGVLSHAPSRLSAGLMLLDGFALEGVTALAVDSVFMMPHLGVFAEVHPDAALEVFYHDCLVPVAHSVVPVWSRAEKNEETVADVYVDGKSVGQVRKGEVSQVDLPELTKITLRVEPRGKQIDVGRGGGSAWDQEITSGHHGLIFDGRNRPFEFAPNEQDRVSAQRAILESLGLFQE